MTQKRNNQGVNKFIRFSTVAIQMGVTIYLGNRLGTWIDQKYNTSVYENIVTLLAIFASMYLVISQVIKITKD